jgi:hypothetical protein
MWKELLSLKGICVVIFLANVTNAFYLPGVAPRKYVHGEQLMVKVNTLTSDLTPLQVRNLNFLMKSKMSGNS